MNYEERLNDVMAIHEEIMMDSQVNGTSIQLAYDDWAKSSNPENWLDICIAQLFGIDE